MYEVQRNAGRQNEEVDGERSQSGGQALSIRGLWFMDQIPKTPRTLILSFLGPQAFL